MRGVTFASCAIIVLLTTKGSSNINSLKLAISCPRGRFFCRLPSRGRHLISGLAKPRFETRRSESRVTAGNEGGFAHLNAVVARLRVGNNLARILACGKSSPDQFIQTKLFRAPQFNGSIQGEPSATRHTAPATSSAAIGWMRADGRRTVLPSVERSAMPLMNSKNCVARTIE